jgi:hypothetical protein
MEAEYFSKRAPDAVLFDSCPDSKNSDCSQRLTWEIRLPDDTLKDLANDILSHEVDEIFLSVEFIFGFVRLQSNNDFGTIPITSIDVELSRGLSENPEEIFGDHKIWGLCGIEGNSQRGYVSSVTWLPRPRQVC